MATIQCQHIVFLSTVIKSKSIIIGARAPSLLTLLRRKRFSWKPWALFFVDDLSHIISHCIEGHRWRVQSTAFWSGWPPLTLSSSSLPSLCLVCQGNRSNHKWNFEKIPPQHLHSLRGCLVRTFIPSIISERFTVSQYLAYIPGLSQYWKSTLSISIHS